MSFLPQQNANAVLQNLVMPFCGMNPSEGSITFDDIVHVLACPREQFRRRVSLGELQERRLVNKGSLKQNAAPQPLKHPVSPPPSLVIPYILPFLSNTRSELGAKPSPLAGYLPKLYRDRVRPTIRLRRYSKTTPVPFAPPPAPAPYRLPLVSNVSPATG